MLADAVSILTDAIMSKADAKIDLKDWYVNTYWAPSREPIAGTEVHIYASAIVAIRKNGQFDRSEYMPTLMALADEKKNLRENQRKLLQKYGRSNDQAVVLEIWWGLDDREVRVEKKRKVDLPKKHYESFLCDIPIWDILEDIYSFCLSRQLRCAMTLDEFLDSLRVLQQLIQYYTKSTERDKNEFCSERKWISQFKKNPRKPKEHANLWIDYSPDKKVETPRDAFSFWIDYIVYRLNIQESRFQDWSAGDIDALGVFCHQMFKSFADELIKEKLISQCEWCQLYFRYRKRKKHCTLLKEDRDCGKKKWSRKYYIEHQDEIRAKYKFEMRDTRSMYREHGLDYDKKHKK